MWITTDSVVINAAHCSKAHGPLPLHWGHPSQGHISPDLNHSTPQRKRPGRWRGAKSDNLLSDQEAVCLQVVSGARSHLPANSPFAFRFEVTI